MNDNKTHQGFIDVHTAKAPQILGKMDITEEKPSYSSLGTILIR